MFPWKKHLVILFTIACLLLNTFAYALYKQYQSIDESNQWVVQSYDLLRRNRRILSVMQDMEIGQRGYMLTRREEFLKPFDRANQQFDEEFRQLRILQNIQLSDDQKQRMEKLYTASEELRVQIVRQLAQYKSTGGKGITVDDIRKSKLLMDKVRALVEEIAEVQVKYMNEQTAQETRAVRLYYVILLLGVILTLSGLVAANAYIFKLVAQSRATEAKLAATEERFLLAMQGTNDGIYDFHVPSNGIYYSPRFKEMLGYKDHEFPNTLDAFNEHIHPEDYERVWEEAQRYFRKEVPAYSNTYRVRHKDGTYRWVLSRGLGIWDKKGEIERLVGAHTDITEQKQREQFLSHLNSEIESFTYIASHDLRSPLVNMKGFASELQLGLDDLKRTLADVIPSLDDKTRTALEAIVDKDMPESVRFVKTAVERMDVLTTAILDLSRIGRREYRFEKLDTTSIVKRCLDALAYDISAKNVEIQLAELPEIISDPLAVEQIMGNIIENAVKYLDPARKGVIAIDAKIYDYETQFSVRDNGRGIAEQEVYKVFDMFRRARNSGDVRGTGMGMAYVKAIIQRLGGRIWLESVLDQGTSVYFTLPRTPRKEKY